MIKICVSSINSDFATKEWAGDERNIYRRRDKEIS